MGRIAFLIGIEANTEGGEDIPIAKVDLGGGDVRRVPLLMPANTDARPRKGDYIALVSNPGDAGYTAVSCGDPDNTSEAADGETRIYARDSSGAIACSVFLKADGSIKLQNDSGSIELKSSGQVDINGNLTVDP